MFFSVCIFDCINKTCARENGKLEGSLGEASALEQRFEERPVATTRGGWVFPRLESFFSCCPGPTGSRWLPKDLESFPVFLPSLRAKRGEISRQLAIYSSRSSRGRAIFLLLSGCSARPERLTGRSRETRAREIFSVVEGHNDGVTSQNGDNNDS